MLYVENYLFDHKNARSSQFLLFPCYAARNTVIIILTIFKFHLLRYANIWFHFVIDSILLELSCLQSCQKYQCHFLLQGHIDVWKFRKFSSLEHPILVE